MKNKSKYLSKDQARKLKSKLKKKAIMKEVAIRKELRRTLITAIGVMVGAAACYVLAKKFGLFEEQNEEQNEKEN